MSRDMVMKGLDKGYFANCCCDDSSAVLGLWVRLKSNCFLVINISKLRQVFCCSVQVIPFCCICKASAVTSLNA